MFTQLNFVFHKDTTQGEHPINLKAKSKLVMLPQAEVCWRWPENHRKLQERSETKSSIMALRENQLCWHLDLTVAYRKVCQYMSVASATQLATCCYSGPGKLIREGKTKQSQNCVTYLWGIYVMPQRVVWVRWKPCLTGLEGPWKGFRFAPGSQARRTLTSGRRHEEILFLFFKNAEEDIFFPSLTLHLVECRLSQLETAKRWSKAPESLATQEAVKYHSEDLTLECTPWSCHLPSVLLQVSPRHEELLCEEDRGWGHFDFMYLMNFS